MRTHIDLCSGIGGFALAARSCGVRTEAFCESDPRCQQFLSRAWPGIPIWPDVRTFPSDAPAYRHAWFVTAGVPCQPASRAGKQGGAADDRWLWPAVLSAVGRLQPTWVLCENPPGIGDVGLAGILDDLGAHGYAVQVLSLPAAAVGAPHRRERYWILAHAGSFRHERGKETRREARDRDKQSGYGDMAHASGTRYQGQEPASGEDGLRAQRPWGAHVWVSGADGKFRRAPDNTVDVAHGLHRSVLSALGNSIVPQVAAEIIGAMIQADA